MFLLLSSGGGKKKGRSCARISAGGCTIQAHQSKEHQRAGAPGSHQRGRGSRLTESLSAARVQELPALFQEFQEIIDPSFFPLPVYRFGFPVVKDKTGGVTIYSMTTLGRVGDNAGDEYAFGTVSRTRWPQPWHFPTYHVQLSTMSVRLLSM